MSCLGHRKNAYLDKIMRMRVVVITFEWNKKGMGSLERARIVKCCSPGIGKKIGLWIKLSGMFLTKLLNVNICTCETHFVGRVCVDLAYHFSRRENDRWPPQHNSWSHAALVWGVRTGHGRDCKMTEDVVFLIGLGKRNGGF